METMALDGKASSIRLQSPELRPVFDEGSSLVAIILVEEGRSAHRLKKGAIDSATLEKVRRVDGGVEHQVCLCVGKKSFICVFTEEDGGDAEDFLEGITDQM